MTITEEKRNTSIAIDDFYKQVGWNIGFRFEMDMHGMMVLHLQQPT